MMGQIKTINALYGRIKVIVDDCPKHRVDDRPYHSVAHKLDLSSIKQASKHNKQFNPNKTRTTELYALRKKK